MKLYRKTDPDLVDCDPTINVTTRISGIINAMTSRSSQGALSTSSAYIEVCILNFFFNNDM